MGSSRKMISGPSDQRHCQVEPSTHAARVGRRQLVRGVDQIELLQEFFSASSTFVLAEMVQVGHEEKVFLTGQIVVDR